MVLTASAVAAAKYGPHMQHPTIGSSRSGTARIAVSRHNFRMVRDVSIGSARFHFMHQSVLAALVAPTDVGVRHRRFLKVGLRAVLLHANISQCK